VTVVLDTTVVIDHLRGLPSAVSYVGALSRQPTCSEITRVEVVRGLRSPERNQARRFFALLDWVPMNSVIAQAAGDLGRQWRRSHSAIDTADLVIAATARALGLDVATVNVRHFPMFTGLTPAYQARS
jgi:predicted nucleic acid-binding protein